MLLAHDALLSDSVPVHQIIRMQSPCGPHQSLTFACAVRAGRVDGGKITAKQS
jgi:hypothetical protein